MLHSSKLIILTKFNFIFYVLHYFFFVFNRLVCGYQLS